MKNKQIVIFIIIVVGLVGLYRFTKVSGSDNFLASLSSPISGSESVDFKEIEESDDLESDPVVGATSMSDLRDNFQEEISLPESDLSYESFRKQITEKTSGTKNSIEESINSFRENLEKEINQRLYRQVCEDLDY